MSALMHNLLDYNTGQLHCLPGKAPKKYNSLSRAVAVTMTQTGKITDVAFYNSSFPSLSSLASWVSLLYEVRALPEMKIRVCTEALTKIMPVDPSAIVAPGVSQDGHVFRLLLPGKSVRRVATWVSGNQLHLMTLPHPQNTEKYK